MRKKVISLAAKPPLKCRLELIRLSFLATIASAQDAYLPDCALKPPKPSRVVTVPGFPAERLYIQRKYPGSCTGGDDKRCSPGTYVISGDRLSVSESCQDWSYVEYRGKRKVSGWVASTRLPNATDKPLPFAESLARSAHPACVEAEALLDQALQKGHEPIGSLPSALRNKTALDALPAGVGQAGGAAGGTQWNVRIQGKRLKAIDYSLGGSCSFDFLELWRPDFSERISLTGSNVDSPEGAWASGDDLVRLRGRTYFVHSTPPRNFQLASFDRSLSTSRICKIEEYPTQREVISFAAAKDLCDAVATGRIERAPIVDIGPIDVWESTLQESVDSKEPIFGHSNLQMIGRGRVDIDNDGTLDDVGIVFYDEASGAGCGHAFHTTWPVKLNANGTPLPHSAFNTLTLNSVDGNDNDARIFAFNGVVYVEYRSRKDADGLPKHEVWKYTKTGATKMCTLVPVRYRAIDTQK